MARDAEAPQPPSRKIRQRDMAQLEAADVGQPHLQGLGDRRLDGRRRRRRLASNGNLGGHSAQREGLVVAPALQRAGHVGGQHPAGGGRRLHVPAEYGGLAGNEARGLLLVRGDAIALAGQLGGDEGLAGGGAEADLRGLGLQGALELGRQGEHHLALAANRDRGGNVELGALHHLRRRDGELAELGAEVHRRGRGRLRRRRRRGGLGGEQG